MEHTINPSIVLDFKFKLEPILEMLSDKEKSMNRKDWVDLTNLFHERIISVPEQYLAGEIPPQEIINATVDFVFDELKRKHLVLTEN